MKGGAVHFNQVGKRYGAVDVLVDFNLDIAPGEFMTLLGPSGSGKTTALNVLAGFVDATSGQVTVNGVDVLAQPPETRNIGMVFQSYSLFPHMNVFENVAFPLRLRKFDRAEIRRRVESSLEMVQLAELAGRMPNDLSGGQRQRVAFARAVVFEPPVLLMDEPLGALDLKLREAMRIEIKRYHRQLGCTIVFVTHDQGEALALSDRIAVMGKGCVVQVGTPDEIYDRPSSRYVAEFIGKTNILTLQPVSSGRATIVELGVEFNTLRDDPSQPRAVRHLSLRPELLRRMPAETKGLIAFEASVRDVIFLGDIVHYTAQVTSGAELMFREYRGHNLTALKSGDLVRLAFDPHEATALANQTPHAP